MSGAAMKWAKRQQLQDAVLQSVVLRLAQYASEKGCAFPSQATLAKDCGVSERSVRRALALLEKLGVISRQPRSKGFLGRTTDMIILALHRDFDLSRKAIQKARGRRAKKNLQPDNGSAATGHSVRGITTGITTVPYQEGELSTEVEGRGTTSGTPTLHDRDHHGNVIEFPRRGAA